MNRLVEMNSNVEVVSLSEVPSVKFTEDGKKIQIEFAIKSEPLPTDPPNPNHPRRDSHRVLRELPPGDLYSGNLSVSLFGLSGQGCQMQISMRLNSKVPGGGGIVG